MKILKNQQDLTKLWNASKVLILKVHDFNQRNNPKFASWYGFMKVKILLRLGTRI